MDSAIELRGLTKRYGKARGIEGLDLAVARGEVFGFLGPNGAGKTTTIRTMLDFQRPTAGTVTLLGLDSQRDAVEIHRRTGYLPGDLALYERLTGRHMTDWLAALRGIDATKERDELAERFGLELDRPIRDLSKGNRQKVGLVQAFMHRPELLLLDEPTGGLDPLMQEEFRVLVRETVAAGATIFLSSHSLDEVERTASRVGVIRDGRMVTVDSVEDLQAKAKRHVLVRFTHPVAVDEFATLPGVSDASATDSEVRLSVVGSLDDIVKAAARHTVVDFVSQPADLEEIFLDVYRSEGLRDG